MDNANGRGFTNDYYIGDIVQVAVDLEARNWGFEAPPNGTRGTIESFEEITYGRFHTCGRGSGIFQNRSYMKVRLGDGTLFSCGRHHLAFVEPGPRTIPHQDFLRPLPATPLWEGDLVRYSPRYEREMPLIPGCGPDIFMVCRVNYDDPTISYDLSYREDGGWALPMRKEGEVLLFRRGRVWNFFHGEPVKFEDREDYGRFLASVTNNTTIRNGNSWMFRKWDAEDAVRENRGHFYAKSGDAYEVHQLLDERDAYEVHQLLDEQLTPVVRDTFLSMSTEPRFFQFPKTC